MRRASQATSSLVRSAGRPSSAVFARPLASTASVPSSTRLLRSAIRLQVHPLSRSTRQIATRSQQHHSPLVSKISWSSTTTQTTTPLLPTSKLGPATKLALRGIRIQGTPKPSLYASTATAANPAWALAGGLAAVGLGGVMLAGYLNRSSTSSLPSAVPSSYRSIDELVASRLRATYGHVASGLGLTAFTAFCLFRVGAAHRVLVMNPWLFMGASLVGTVGSMLAIQALPQDRTVARALAWGTFHACNGLALSPVALLGGAVVARAVAATGAVVGSLSLVAAMSPSESFLRMGGTLGVGLGVVMAASMGQMFFPGSAVLSGVALYGGLGVFGLLMLYDTQRVIMHAKVDPAFDPMKESLGIYLNTINIFVRMVSLLSSQQRNRK